MELICLDKMPDYSIEIDPNSPEARPRNPVYPLTKELRDVSDIREIARLLDTGDWIVLDVHHFEEDDMEFTFVLSRVQ